MRLYMYEAYIYFHIYIAYIHIKGVCKYLLVWITYICVCTCVCLKKSAHFRAATGFESRADMGWLRIVGSLKL